MTATAAPQDIHRAARVASGFLAAYWTYFSLLCAVLIWTVWRVLHLHLVPLLQWPLVAFAGGLLAHLLWTSVPRRRRAPFGHPLDLNTQPGLRQLIETAAQTAQVPVPDEVRLLPDMNAYMSVRGRHSTLGLGLPLLLSLPHEEVLAVIAHELGHLSGGDAASAWRRASWVSGMFRTVISLRRASPEWVVAALPQGLSTLIVLYMLLGNLIALPMTALARAYLRVTRSMNHAQELAADRAAQQVAGGAAMQAALRRIAVESRLFDAFVQSDVLPLAQAGYRVPLADGFRMFLRGEWTERLRGWQAQALPEFEATLSHPSLRARLEQLGHDGSQMPEPHPVGTSLLQDADTLGDTFYHPRAQRTLRAVTWQDLNRVHWPDYWQGQATDADLRTALRGLTLWHLPNVCADLNAHLRARFPQVQYEGVGGDERKILVSWLAIGVLNAALRQGAQAAVQPGHPWAIELNGQFFAPLTALWQMVTDPQDRADWTRHLERLGLRDAPLLDC